MWDTIRPCWDKVYSAPSCHVPSINTQTSWKRRCFHACLMQCSIKSSQYGELKLNIDKEIEYPKSCHGILFFPKRYCFRMSKSIPHWHRNPIFCSVSVTLRWRRSWHPQIASAVAIAQETFTSMESLLFVSDTSPGWSPFLRIPLLNQYLGWRFCGVVGNCHGHHVLKHRRLSHLLSYNIPNT